MIENPSKFEYPTSDLTIDQVSYYLDSYSPSPSVTEVDVNNSAGEYVNSVYVKGKTTASFSFRKMKEGDALPVQFKTFEYDEKTWRIKTVAKSQSSGAVTTYTMECDEVVTEPVA